MEVITAQLPEPPEGADRVFATDNAVILLDGATSFTRQPISGAEYADTLGAEIQRGLIEAPERDLIDVLAESINRAALCLSLESESSPSSTVAIARESRRGVMDLLVLGDSQIATPIGVLRDDRIGAIGSIERSAYREHLRRGGGFDATHRELIEKLRNRQLEHRNRASGYWIAGADPFAAAAAVVAEQRIDDFPWLVLATDGAYKPLQELEADDWRELAALSRANLQMRLRPCQAFESSDPEGRLFPRAKLHDDKTFAVLRIR